MTTYYKNHPPKIGEVYVAKADVEGLYPKTVPSVHEDAAPVQLLFAREIPKGTHVLLLDVLLKSDVVGAGYDLRENILYKILSLKLRTVLYVGMASGVREHFPKANDYKMAAHAFFLSFSEMSNT